MEFEEYAEARWGTLVRSGVALGCSVPEAQDLAQTALVKAYLSWERVVRADDPNAYLHRILLNAFRDSRRRRWWGERPGRVPERARDPEVDAVDGADVVDRAMAALSREQREVVVLRVVADLPERRTAEILGIAPGTVKSRLSRALAILATSPHLVGLPEIRNERSDP